MMRNYRLSLRLWLRCSVVLLTLFSTVTVAHTSLKTSVPADGQIVSAVPKISVEFGAPIRLMALELTNSGGTVIPTGFSRSPAKQSRFEIALTASLPSSTYKVSWMAMGDDGHKIDGSFGFTLDLNSKAPIQSAKPLDKPVQFSGMDLEAAKVVLAFHKALKDGDKEIVKRILADDVVIFEGGGVERSEAEYEHHHMSADMAYLKEMSIETIEHHVQVSGNAALSLSRSKVTGTYKGKTIDREGMETITLLKKNDQWLISHIHWSN